MGAIFTPVIIMPLWIFLVWNYRKAEKAGLVPSRQDNRTTLQSLKYYAIEFDLIGLLLIARGLTLVLPPFILYSYQANGWRSALVIGMIIVGALPLVAFGLYFSSFLQVVNNLGVTKASYVVNTCSIESCFWSRVVGVLVCWTGRFKRLALYFGVPLTILGLGLMIKFRQPEENVGFIIMCQIFIVFAGGTLAICEQTAVMVATAHQYIAVILTVESMFSSIGGAIGATVAGAIWTGTFPKNLAGYLPADAQGNLTEIYESLDVQISYEFASETRNTIARAYGDS